MTALTHDDVAALGGPDWLTAARRDAFDAFTAAELPTSGEEVWRYSRIDELDLDRYVIAAGTAPSAPSGPAGDQLARLRDAIGDAALTVHLADGRLVDVEVADPGAKATVGRLVDHADGPAWAAQLAGRSKTALSQLHAALAVDPVVIDVAAGAALAQPIVVIDWTATDGAIIAPHVVIRAGADAEATVVHLQASPDLASLVLPVVDVDLAPASRLRYLNVQDHGHRMWQLARQNAQVERDATFRTLAVALGGDYARLRLDTRLDGLGAEAELVAVYFGEGDQMHDFRTLQDHIAPRTRSELLFKGAVEDRAHSVYSGMIHIGPEARGTAAYQTNRNLTLSPDARAESVPNLEIENNEVTCSHASAVGPVDDDQAFYLASRGVPPEIAERLIVLGFFDEVLERLPIGSLAPALRGSVADKLDRRGQA